jgi:GAF domain-containing protein
MARPSRTGGKRSAAKTRKASAAKGRHSAKTKRRIAPTASPKRSTVSAPGRELKEAREQQAATAEILRVIAGSPGDVQPILEAVAKQTNRLVSGLTTVVWRILDDVAHLAAFTHADPAADAALKAAALRIPLSSWQIGETIRKGKVFSIADTERDVRPLRDLARVRGFRSVLYVPMLHNHEPIGVIGVTRAKPGRFADHHVWLVKTFADQAAIAINNAQLFEEVQSKTRDLEESLQQQTATSEVLEVISSSMGDVQPVFEEMLEKAARVCGAEFGLMGLFDGGVYRRVALYNVPAGFIAVAPKEVRLDDEGPIASVRRTRQVFTTDDFRQSKQYLSGHPLTVALVDVAGARTLAIVPMLKDGKVIGVISIYRQEVRPFGDKQIKLLKNFANQAVIAIENTRLFNETRDALERQTATADILKVIASSPSDVQPVFEAIAERSNRLIESLSTAVYSIVGDTQYLMAFTRSTPEADAALQASFPLPLSAATWGDQIRNGQIVQVPDFAATVEWAEQPALQKMARLRGFRALLLIPLRRDGATIGVISVTRKTPGAFSDHHVQLLQTFADQAVIAIENARLFNEVQAKTADLEESLQQQTATSDVLKVISRSTFDLNAALGALVSSARELCNAPQGMVLLRDGDVYRMSMQLGYPPEFEQFIINNPIVANRQTAAGRAAITKKVAHLPDVLADPEYQLNEGQRLGCYRAMLSVPMVREDNVVGVFSLARTDPGPFSKRQVELVETFADQALIAIENARLLRELRKRTDDLTEALVYQTGSSNILKVIASSPTDVGPALKAIVESACEICGAYDAAVLLREGRDLLFSAHHGPIPRGFERWPINRNWVSGRAVVDKVTQHVHDVLGPEGDDFLETREIARREGHRTVLSVPLLREDETIGAIALRRIEVQPFNDKQIELLKSFADQAVIAISNVRLFEEVQTKTRDLTEALTYQTGSANILNVIASSPTDVRPVLQAIVESACELCGAYDALVRVKDGDGLAFGAHHGPLDVSLESVPISGDSTAGQAVIGGKPVHVHDLQAPDGDRFPRSQELARSHGERTILSVPLLRENEAIGVIVIRRLEVHPFSNKQIALLQTFADQAVIAIGNVRLFDEVQAKTHDLEEALRYQTGSANILSVIASSPTEVGPVLKAIVKSACELCEANDAIVALKDGDDLVFQEQHGSIAVVWTRRPINRRWTAGRAVADCKAVHVHDLSAEGDEFPEGQEIAIRDHVRTALSVPLLRENERLGVIMLRRTEVQPFSDKQIALLQTFADQAVIAIGNVRLFEQVRERTRDLQESLNQQTATSEVLQVISSSPGELGPVFDKMLENATRVCGAEFGSMVLVEGDTRRNVAIFNGPPAFVEARAGMVGQIHPRSSIAAAIRTRQVVQVEDLRNNPAYLERDPAAVHLTELGGARTIVVAPMLREDDVIGLITVYRQEVRLFSDKQIDLLTNFARQAVIAMENARLLRELRERTDDLSKSLDELRAAQDRLVQTEKLASLGQLTAGIAHEIKNPLNFVNNFSQLSAELLDEMTDVFQNSKLDEASRRKELDEIRELLKANLEKVVQHGKRADSIVRNMLQHSREGSGEHRFADINAIVEDSLNLAYHGARAEKSGFTITLRHDLDPHAGAAELYPQEITRALLNLIANGFYAATRRKAETADESFEPVLSAATKGLDTTVEIRIRDNGTGIPSEVKEKMFNPFFTTKPTGEGTGLGLSMTHDIVVKQHGGRIDVETRLGEFTEFIITLPRNNRTGVG